MGTVLMGLGGIGGVWSYKVAVGICIPLHSTEETVA